jgi:hypothetical protein
MVRADILFSLLPFQVVRLYVFSRQMVALHQRVTDLMSITLFNGTIPWNFLFPVFFIKRNQLLRPVGNPQPVHGTGISARLEQNYNFASGFFNWCPCKGCDKFIFHFMFPPSTLCVFAEYAKGNCAQSPNSTNAKQKLTFFTGLDSGDDSVFLWRQLGPKILTQNSL